ncbi:hypothetical protein ILUMI_18651 [Ignelater luminosus]|uniref:Uncharacterized protein n=1 Tax=Ignelater luminosus TaxID=2038154 RepID=A0A8K0G0P1_IGNLU|nr:hypothetical protein ILUMI_18651 [Ignelater luminosus]
MKMDWMLKNIIPADLQPRSVKLGHASSKRIDRDRIIEHIIFFHPEISHYRREHAPLRKYLPSDFNITLMHKDFVGRYPDVSISYELYRKQVYSMNISFAVLGHTECWACETFNMHCKSAGHGKVSAQNPDCDLFFSADLQKIEKSLKAKAKVLDFDDFECFIQNSNNGRVFVKSVKISDFYNFEDCSSKYKISKIIPRLYLSDMVYVSFTRNPKTLRYQTEFCGEQKEVNFLAAKYYKDEFIIPTCRTIPRGVSKEEKANLIPKLKSIAPKNRLKFWEDLPISKNPAELDDGVYQNV